MSNKLFLIAFSLLLSLAQTSCNSDDDNGNEDGNARCEGTICTAIFIRINVSLTDQDQNPVALDSFTVTNLQNGEDMTVSLTPSELAEAQETGLYPLTEDGSFGLNEEREVQFKGFINDQEVLSSDYIVSTDCCHVGLDSGDLELTL
ncbi:hypothetical protein [Poritiphilus flavus]|uniref:Lipoprotein n=1 Tax=Poritiphilus flavus TaxID=2697053 RepID=A0A6L9EHQ8_9FLAO|nr:hypothetical protein [Poritiphilus flavus]NAS14038.1 hypothetical protein [Poritiphilus flavus]